LAQQQSYPPRSSYILAVVFGAVCASVDFFLPTQVVSGFIVAFAFLLSLTYPVKAWAWALIIGACVSLANLFAYQLGVFNPRRLSQPVYFIYLAFLPAFIGAYSAVLLRRYAAKQEGKS
jgi:hypothetical protein